MPAISTGRSHNQASESVTLFTTLYFSYIFLNNWIGQGRCFYTHYIYILCACSTFQSSASHVNNCHFWQILCCSSSSSSAGKFAYHTCCAPNISRWTIASSNKDFQAAILPSLDVFCEVMVLKINIIIDICKSLCLLVRICLLQLMGFSFFTHLMCPLSFGGLNCSWLSNLVPICKFLFNISILTYTKRNDYHFKIWSPVKIWATIKI